MVQEEQENKVSSDMGSVSDQRIHQTTKYAAKMNLLLSTQNSKSDANRRSSSEAYMYRQMRRPISNGALMA